MPVVYLFDEILLDPEIFSAGSATGSPEFANTMIRNPATGIYKVNVVRYDIQNVWNLNIHLLDADMLEYFNEFWGGGHGSAYGFRARIVTDFYVEDEVIGTGDGSTTIFQLTKRYSRPGANHYYTRRIIKPVVVPSPLGSSVALYEPNGTTPRVIPSTLGAALTIPAFTVKKDGVTTTAYTVDNTTGKITFTVAPANGVVISWSGEFDTPVRFMQNSFQMKPDVASEVAGLQLCEILPAELGIS